MWLRCDICSKVAEAMSSTSALGLEHPYLSLSHQSSELAAGPCRLSNALEE
jgi:hypothetical protein